jgi:hypothetical protein
VRKYAQRLEDVEFSTRWFEGDASMKTEKAKR